MAYSVNGDLCSERGLRLTFGYLTAVAEARATITYGEIATKLAHDLNIKGTVFPTHIGHVVGTLMHRILEVETDAPLINLLVVNQESGVPSEGANDFLRNRYHLTPSQVRQQRHRRELIARETETAHKFTGWPELYRRIFPEGSQANRNPTWVSDELILALDMYLRFAGNPPGKGSAEIAELSETLNRLARYLGLTKADRFRNPNGVYMKLMNFRRLDPAFVSAGKVGLSRGGKAEEDVWDQFASHPARCHEVAETIRKTLAAIPEGETVQDDLVRSEIEEAAEGRVVTALHRRYERNAAIVKSKKGRVLATLGKLACEVCEFDFQRRYGNRGTGFIECHHTKPPGELKAGEKTRIGDLRAARQTG